MKRLRRLMGGEMIRVRVEDGWTLTHRGRAVRPGMVVKLDTETARRLITGGAVMAVSWWRSS
jgi:hypothetical protein